MYTYLHSFDAHLWIYFKGKSLSGWDHQFSPVNHRHRWPVGAWIVLGCGWPSRTSSDHVWMVFPADPSGWVLMCRSGANPREWRAIPTSLNVKILESLDMLMTRKSWRSAENIWTSRLLISWLIDILYNKYGTLSSHNYYYYLLLFL